MRPWRLASGGAYWNRPVSIGLMASTRPEASENSRNFPCRPVSPKASPGSDSARMVAPVRTTWGIFTSADSTVWPGSRSFRNPRIASRSGISGMVQRLWRPAASRANICTAVRMPSRPSPFPIEISFP